ncbi:hypothetical protein A6770_26830 [Nostoc minutum NIES-26]|uniref:PEP-CTERM protein-sorting domain-containing protein n=1 Tax=Nostoc minutum NIES-26 TaxID=1844469 RepID=A0A367QQC5_9NOSO|nr:hypothetical protein A6770_26830 [Nostoc minutum NIES-26]
MKFNNLKKLLVATTVFTIATCLVPNSAQAGLGKASGGSANSTKFSFDFNTSVTDSNPDNNVGFFAGAIENFKIRLFDIDSDNPSDNLNPGFCGVAVGIATCPPGNLTITQLTTVDGIVPGIGITLDQLQGTFNSFFGGTQVIDFFQNVIRYDVTLDGAPESELIWFIQSNDFNLINDLSGLNASYKIIGLYPGDPFGSQFTIQLVPEPTTTMSLLSIGTLGIVSLLKRQPHLKNLLTTKK